MMLDGNTMLWAMKQCCNATKLMTYDVLTRRPLPDFAFLVGRFNALGVPAREAETEPGARSG
jgi:hypothetical protein